MIADWKFQIVENVIKMPVGAKIHKQVILLNGAPCIWAQVNTETELEDVLFQVISTGEQIRNYSNLKYIGVFQDETGCVKHLYKEKSKPESTVKKIQTTRAKVLAKTKAKKKKSKK
jgi:hypothetical protein